MGYIGRRIGKSQDSGDSNPAGADGAVGGGILDLFSNGYFERQGDIFNNPGTGNVAAQASGGVVAEYSSGSDIYKSHTFNASGSFVITSPGTGSLAEFDILVVGGGGGGGCSHDGHLGGAVEVVLFSIFLDKLLVLERILL